MGNNHHFVWGSSRSAPFISAKDGYIIKKVIEGATLGNALAAVRFDAAQLHDHFRRSVMQRNKDGELSTKDGNQLIEYYEKQADSYTYLSPNGNE
jgi:arginine decarboxylase-like protein